MIAVIADDLTGAAELAGIGKTYGLTVELAIGRHSVGRHALSVNPLGGTPLGGTPQSTVDLLVLATDARSVSEAEAVQEMTDVSAVLRSLNPQLIFKKVDSVLRGHVVAETLAQMKVLDLPKALIVPANPALGRMLIDGHYYVQGRLIHETHFSEDPEFPVTESNVLKRLLTNDASIRVQPPTTALPPRGITIGEVGTQGDLKAWVQHLDKQTLPGGGAGFFTAILGADYSPQYASIPLDTFGECRLFVCGSSFGHSVALVKKAAMAGPFVCYMPAALMQSNDPNPTELADWVADIVTCFGRHQQVIMAIPPGSGVAGVERAVWLRTIMARAVNEVLNQVAVDELMIEGGSTASAVLREIDVTRLAVAQELAAGVVRSKALEKAELHITVKPGSYQWPPDLWPF